MSLNRNALIGGGVAAALIALVIVVAMHGNFLTGWLESFQTLQRDFHDQLATIMRDIATTHSHAATLALIAVGFIYGAFHAVGPGHGKLVVTGYLLANDESLKRGLIVIALSSLMQAMVAIAVVLGLFYTLGLARTQMEYAAAWLETVSFALIALVGAGLLRRGIREAIKLKQPHTPLHHNHHHIHAHHAHHTHDDHSGCGHSHVPAAQAMARAHGIGDLLLMVVSIGIRPCSGAVILLLFACLIGTVGVGIAATFAMAIGTGLTTALLAIAAVKSKGWILKTMQATDRTLGLTHAALAIGGGLLIAVLGIILAFTSLPAGMVVGARPAGLMVLPAR